MKLLRADNPGYVDLQSPAGMGISVIVFNYDGDVYASDEARMLKEMGDEKFRLGNLFTDSYEEILGSDVLLDTLEQSLVESVPMCSSCGYQTLCGSDPTYHTLRKVTWWKKPLSFFLQQKHGGYNPYSRTWRMRVPEQSSSRGSNGKANLHKEPSDRYPHSENVFRITKNNALPMVLRDSQALILDECYMKVPTGCTGSPVKRARDNCSTLAESLWHF